MKISVSETDCRDPYVTAINNPISAALHRKTGRLWYVFDGHSIACTREPLQQITLPPKVSRWWREFQNSDFQNPDKPAPSLLEFELEIKYEA